MSKLAHLILEQDGPVATITLNRPERLNAYTTAMGIELFSTLAQLDAKDDVRVILITGAGRAFCAGADLEPKGATFSGERTWQSAAELQQRVAPWRLRTPIIAVINGPAVGIGATLPLSWDLRIASDRARMGFVFTRRGILPEAGSTWILPRLVGLAKAMDLLLTGRILGAQEALDYGLVSRVVPHDDLMTVAREMARDIAENTAPLSVALTRTLLWQQLLEADPVAAKAREDELFYWLGKQADAAEGVTAFLEKRAPAWTLSKNQRAPGEDEPR